MHRLLNSPAHSITRLAVLLLHRIMTHIYYSHQSMSMLIPEIKAFLRCETPHSWIEWALQHPEELLLDHANCEKKAAGTALTLMFRYSEREELQQYLSRLAREELRHFEQVTALMKKRGMRYRQLSASNYAKRLHTHIAHQEPDKLIDTLIVGAFIEARSCERFYRLAPYLDDELQRFYMSLLKAEARHFEGYLRMAELYAKQPIDERVAFFAEVEREAVLTEDEVFRFHSGVPKQPVDSSAPVALAGR